MLTLDDDDPGSHQPRLDGIMKASLLDDWGMGNAIFECIMDLCWPWYSGCCHSHSMGPRKDSRAIKMVSQKTPQSNDVPSL